MKKHIKLANNFLISNNHKQSFDIMRRIFFVEAFRLGIYTLITLLFLFFQIRQSLFTSLDIIIPTYTILGIGFSLNTIYLFLYDKIKKNFLIKAMSVLFLFDVVLITTLLHVTGLTQSLFMFLYMINIILCGLVFRKQITLFLALFTSFSFTILMVLSPSVEGIGVTIGINNLAFFIVAFLTSFLSDHINILDTKIADQSDDISNLKNLNKLIIDSMPSGIIVFETSGQIIYKNSAIDNIVTDLKKINVFKNFKSLKTNLMSKSYAKEDICTWEETVNIKGNNIILGLNLVPLQPAKENFVHVLIVQDLTQIKKLESISRQKEKLAAVGTLASGLAHEIRNPLTGISGSVQLLNSDSFSKENKKVFDIISKEAQRLNELLDDFLSYAKPGSNANDSVDINAIIREVLVMIKSSNEHVRQKVTLDAKVGVIGDADRLKQVFYNLFLNAYQAMELVDNAILTVRSYVKDKKLYVSIQDTGSCIPDDVQSKIFEPFVTTKSSGTGLGLATAYNILQSHDAKITMTSSQVTEFVIEFTKLCNFKDVLDMDKMRV